MHYSYTLGFLLLCSLLTAQTTPWFSITFHVEDAVGNRDSVVVGVDPEASTVELDPAFGEVLLDSPFDSVLEARAAKKFSADRLLAKRIITKGSPFANDPDNCFSGIILIYIHAKHQPVRVYWDRSKYVTDDCHSGAFLLNHYEFEVSFPPPDPEDLSPLYFCMAAADSAEVRLTGDQPDSIGEPLVELRWEVEGQGEQSPASRWYLRMK